MMLGMKATVLALTLRTVTAKGVAKPVLDLFLVQRDGDGAMLDNAWVSKPQGSMPTFKASVWGDEGVNLHDMLCTLSSRDGKAGVGVDVIAAFRSVYVEAFKRQDGTTGFADVLDRASVSIDPRFIRATCERVVKAEAPAPAAADVQAQIAAAVTAALAAAGVTPASAPETSAAGPSGW